MFKMYRASRVHPDNAICPNEQVCFYDPGLRTDIGARGLTGLVRKIDKLLQSVTGRGITKNMADCYEFIINHYQPGDRIYLIGFSRGAYTVRCLANAMMLCGVPTRAGDGFPLLRFRKQVHDIAKEAVDKVYEHGAGHARGEFEAERDELARRFRDKYASNFSEPTDDDTRSNAAPYFTGVYDTVAALGASGRRRTIIKAGLTILFATASGVASTLLAIPFSLGVSYYRDVSFWWSELAISTGFVALSVAWYLYRQRAQYTKTIYDFPNKGDKSSHQAEWKSEFFDRLLSRYVGTARSANAIDERRKDFDRVTWGQKDSYQLAQCWFAGNHSDVGGSYPETESRLSDISLQWMLEEVLKLQHPIQFGPVTVNGEATVGAGSRARLCISFLRQRACNTVRLPEHGTPSIRFANACLGSFVGCWRTRTTKLSSAQFRRKRPYIQLLHNASSWKRSSTVRTIRCATIGPRRLGRHNEFQRFYLDPAPADAPRPGRREEASLPSPMPSPGDKSNCYCRTCAMMRKDRYSRSFFAPPSA